MQKRLAYSEARTKILGLKEQRVVPQRHSNRHAYHGKISIFKLSIAGCKSCGFQ